MKLVEKISESTSRINSSSVLKQRCVNNVTDVDWVLKTSKSDPRSNIIDEKLTHFSYLDNLSCTHTHTHSLSLSSLQSRKYLVLFDRHCSTSLVIAWENYSLC